LNGPEEPADVGRATRATLAATAVGVGVLAVMLLLWGSIDTASCAEATLAVCEQLESPSS
jgi:hypothetical protein